MRIIAEPGSRLTLKSRFVLNNPDRLVIDLENAKLDSASIPFPSATLGGVPVSNIRLGQFTEDTVRIVVETSDPRNLHVSLDRNTLAIEGNQPQGLISHLYDFLRGRKPSPQPPPAYTPFPPRRPAVPPADGPLTQKAPASETASRFENLRKLQGLQPNQLPDFDRRMRIIEIARGQLGLSKDADRDYINRTFSQGQDNAWCADFVSTVLNWAGGSPWGHYSRVQDIYDWGASHGRLTASPLPANLVIFRYGMDGFDHVSFIESVDAEQNTITTIGGNEGYAATTGTAGSVNRATYHLDDRRILGFVDPISGASSLPGMTGTAR